VLVERATPMRRLKAGRGRFRPACALQVEEMARGPIRIIGPEIPIRARRASDRGSPMFINAKKLRSSRTGEPSRSNDVRHVLERAPATSGRTPVEQFKQTDSNPLSLTLNVSTGKTRPRCRCD